MTPVEVIKLYLLNILLWFVHYLLSATYYIENPNLTRRGEEYNHETHSCGIRIGS